ncbi:mechanosensitive ion channel family protein [Ornithinibacillus sp. BX22]|uniref:Mechanosensing system component YbdG n=2 Tax=Ornithinibacillus TaxID=484508 RepID=A0A923L830_9BACI|nr:MULTISPECIES: mechanosensitive ion channel family protein [Ornithinibacillus]MBC5638144.1 mechanosensitive ion channel family protein [Ornithinibacillus hominis]MBS3680784.1 mechanosensitive ion channel family protein [Ornithinibacillus massiliensis]
MEDFITNWVADFDLEPATTKYLTISLKVLAIALICIIANFITKKIVVRIITRVIRNNKYTWDNVFIERKVFHRLSHIVPAIIIYQFATSFPNYVTLIQKASNTYIILIMLLVINSTLHAINDIYRTFEVSKTRPIKGYIQVANIIFVIIGAILIIANLIGESPLVLLGGIGALSAVIMLVFQDSILGLVAGVQLTTNDMVRVGDWIEMPKYDADGDVIDITLNTVKVQNWDKTISMIPAYALVSNSFKNWRGMQDAGGRRIKRSLYLDTTSIGFCSPEMMERLKQIQILSDYITEREAEIEEYNRKHKVRRENPVNGRAMTNIGVFRAYVENYLKRHPGIRQDMTLMVRQLDPTENGLPLEIYAFTNTTEWAAYESIQSDIFDHLFAIAKEFGLRLFQNPTGNDLKYFRAMENEEVHTRAPGQE